jgi:hypothetical protein
MGVKADLLTQLKLAGLPAPEAERPVVDGRRYRWDYCWPVARLAVDVQGGVWTRGHHLRGRGYVSDCEKLALGVLCGWRVLWVPTDWIRNGKALQVIRQALEGRP